MITHYSLDIYYGAQFSNYSPGFFTRQDLNEVVPWFHAALLCGQDLDAPQGFQPRLYKTHQLPLGCYPLIVIVDFPIKNGGFP